MKKISLLVTAIAAMAFASCQQEVSAPESEGLFRVTSEAASRATVDDLGVFTWSETDKVAVITDAGVKTLDYVRGAGTSNAAFEGDLTGVTSASAAVYPASVATATGKVNLPAEYDYVAGEVYTPLYVANPSLTETNEMKHLGGAIKIVIDAVPTTAAAFRFTTSNRIAGEFEVNTEGEVPVIATEASETDNAVTVNFTPGSATSMAFFIPLPVGTYANFKAELLDAEGTPIDASLKAKTSESTVSRKAFVIMPGYTPSVSVAVEELYSSSVVVRFSSSAFQTIANDVNKSYRVELYNDAEMEDLVVSWGLKPGTNSSTDHFNKFTTSVAKNPRFVFTGLTPGTKYYFVAKDVTDPENVYVSNPLEFTTPEFSPVDISALAAGSAAAGDVILNEDFGEIVVGGFLCDNANQAVGYVANGDFAKSEDALTPASGFMEMNEAESAKYNYTADGNRYLMFGWGNNYLYSTLAPAIAKTRLKDWGQISKKLSDLTQTSSNVSGVLSTAAGLRLGTGSWYGISVTPALSALSGIATIKVTVRAHAAGSDNSVMGIGLMTSATVSEDNAHAYLNPEIKEVESVSLAKEMTVYEYEIPNVMPTDKLAIGVAPSAMKAGGSSMRIIIKEIKVEVVSYGETVIPIPTDIATAEDLVNFLTLVDASSETESKIVADIDMKNVEFTPAKGFAGVLDGQGHSIKNLSGNKPLFSTNSGTLKNIVIDGTCAYTPGVEDFAPFVITNSGTLENLTNKASITINVPDATVRHYVGGIASSSSGPMTNCTNEGAITLTSAKGVSCSLIGGIAGELGAKAEGCVNKGELKIEALYSNVPVAKAPYTQTVGSAISGIAAIAMKAGFNIVNSSNEAPVSYIETSVDSGTHTTGVTRHGACGICSYPFGEINGCVNDGKISNIIRSSTGAVYNARENLVAGAGISGSDFVWHAAADKAAATSVINCINNGEVFFHTDIDKSNSTCGGIVSWPNPEEAGNKNFIQGCTNNGTITLEGPGKVRLGGISGGVGAIKDCINNGKIVVKSAGSACVVGGIQGFTSRNYEISGNKFLGEIDASASGVILAIGGIHGQCGNYAMSKLFDNKVNAVITAPADQTELGLVVGNFSGTSSAITIGTAEKPIVVAGKVNGTLITADNFSGFLYGPAKYTEGTHTVNAVYGE